MTIFAGHIVDTYNFLNELVTEVGDIDAAGSFDLAQLGKAARGLKEGVEVGIGSLDLKIGSDATGGLATAVAGAFPMTTGAMLLAQLADLNQMDILLDIRGYAGRVLINVEQAGGAPLPSPRAFDPPPSANWDDGSRSFDDTTLTMDGR